MAYKKDVAPNEGGDENQDDDSKSDKHGNLGLPFGLCAKYGIPLPENATPRMAWNALKEHKGMYPPWTEKGEGQYSDEDNGEDKDKSDDEQRQQTAVEIGKKLRGKLKGRFSKEYQEALENALENLDDNEITAFSATVDNLTQMKNGSGVFYPGINVIHIPAKDSASEYDKELGYSFPAETFFHEYGHFLGHMLWKKQGAPSGAINFNWDFTVNIPNLSEAVSDDIKDFIGDGKDVWERLGKIANKDFYNLSKPTEFDYDKTYQENLELLRQYYEEEKAQAKAKEWTDKGKAKNEERVRLWNEYGDEEIMAGKANFHRMSFLSDSISIATSGRYDSYKHGFSAHSATYSRKTTNGVEAWAEFVAIKMMKDKKGEEAYRKYMPRTYKIFSEQYAKMGEILK
jgi:hypothetical protein